MFKTLPTTLDEFYQEVLVNSLAAIKVNHYLDNFDAARFNNGNEDLSEAFNVYTHAFYFDWFVKKVTDIFQAYTMLDDETSRELYLHLLAYRLGGHLSVKLPVSFIEKNDEYEAYKKLEAFVESEINTDGMFGNIKHYDFIFNNERYVVDCLGLESYLFRKQYFYDRNNLQICPEPGDFLIDGGACFGDTAQVFSNSVGEDGKVYAFDPIADHLAILEYNIAQSPKKNIVAMPYGLSDRTVDAPPLVLNQYAPGFNSNNSVVPLRQIDQLVASGDIQKVNFIKFDIEGAEMEGLRGAKATIELFKPKLAISLYHKPDDIFEIITYIKNNFPFYSLFLDHYTIHQEETVLYCKPNL